MAIATGHAGGQIMSNGWGRGKDAKKKVVGERCWGKGVEEDLAKLGERRWERVV